MWLMKNNSLEAIQSVWLMKNNSLEAIIILGKPNMYNYQDYVNIMYLFLWIIFFYKQLHNISSKLPSDRL
jgi:uncharacterized membrane protein